jgi:hypothetical protein
MDATISWLSQVRLDCYPHWQSFLLQHKMIALLAAQQSLDIALRLALE